MWYYYETFLEQTQTLTVDPIRKMAKQFTILKVSARRERERGGWVDGKRERVCVFLIKHNFHCWHIILCCVCH